MTLTYFNRSFHEYVNAYELMYTPMCVCVCSFGVILKSNGMYTVLNSFSLNVCVCVREREREGERECVCVCNVFCDLRRLFIKLGLVWAQGKNWRAFSGYRTHFAEAMVYDTICLTNKPE